MLVDRGGQWWVSSARSSESRGCDSQHSLELVGAVTPKDPHFPAHRVGSGSSHHCKGLLVLFLNSVLLYHLLGKFSILCLLKRANCF